MERDAFQAGTKRVAIISDAASAGVSLQADKSKGNRVRQCVCTCVLSHVCLSKGCSCSCWRQPAALQVKGQPGALTGVWEGGGLSTGF